jgi:hypothetical protein
VTLFLSAAAANAVATAAGPLSAARPLSLNLYPSLSLSPVAAGPLSAARPLSLTLSFSPVVAVAIARCAPFSLSTIKLL